MAADSVALDPGGGTPDRQTILALTALAMTTSGSWDSVMRGVIALLAVAIVARYMANS